MNTSNGPGAPVPDGLPTSSELVAALMAGMTMRSLQRAYFKTRTQQMLVASKEAEREFDRQIAELVSRCALVGEGKLI